MARATAMLEADRARAKMTPRLNADEKRIFANLRQGAASFRAARRR